MQTSFKRSATLDPERVRQLVQEGKDRGLIHGGGPSAAEKKGAAAVTLGTVRSQWMEVDPATARRWLENNFRNRPVKEDVVQAYARDMLNGVWVATHQGIAFNDRDASRETLQQDLATAAMALMDTLTEREREILAGLFGLRGGQKNYRQIAGELGVSHQTVYSLRNAALAKLRQRLHNLEFHL